jgi:tetratricopeptide (TPR) repeat protein
MKPNCECEATHPQITAGKCLWCDEVLGEVDTGDAAMETVWNVDAMAAALDDENPTVRAMTVTNLCHSGLSLEVSLPLYAKALQEKSGRLAVNAEQHLVHLGRNLQVDDVARLEVEMAGSPNERALRIVVLPFYFLGQRESDAARERRNKHIYWLIENAPESNSAGSPHAWIDPSMDAQAYEKAKQLWLKQVQAHPGSGQIHGNAAGFFTRQDHSLSESLLKRARDLEPANPEWPDRLGHLYSLESRDNSADARTNAAKAFEALAIAQELCDRELPPDDSGEELTEEQKRTLAVLSTIWRLPELAKAAFAASEFEQARNYATELLQKAASPELDEFFRDDGNAIHHANLILGRLAFREGDIEHAKQYLIAAGKTNGSPQLNSFGPNMSLAKELLECGEQETVLRYFELCRKFWGSHSDLLDQWTQDVRAGRIPEFGANLVY